MDSIPLGFGNSPSSYKARTNTASFRLVEREMLMRFKPFKQTAEGRLRKHAEASCFGRTTALVPAKDPIEFPLPAVPGIPKHQSNLCLEDRGSPQMKVAVRHFDCYRGADR